MDKRSSKSRVPAADGTPSVCSMPLGRLFVGHVNPLKFVLRYGHDEQVGLVAEEARAGKMLCVWNTDGSNGLRLIRTHACYWLEGRKVLASGAGHIERPLVTATDEAGRRFVQRSVGLQAFTRPNPIERVSRDLATYLRQLGPDRAVTNAAAGILAQPVGAQDPWR
ncbi:MAG TPA: hypothetical protein VNY10_06100 [Roseiarcus sp.]|jgi:hypothetical protein|nr:hypothetical protein [Roseiarcus sp.]